MDKWEKISIEIKRIIDEYINSLNIHNENINNFFSEQNNDDVPWYLRGPQEIDDFSYIYENNNFPKHL